MAGEVKQRSRGAVKKNKCTDTCFLRFKSKKFPVFSQENEEVFRWHWWWRWFQFEKCCGKSGGVTWKIAAQNRRFTRYESRRRTVDSWWQQCCVCGPLNCLNLQEWRTRQASDPWYGTNLRCSWTAPLFHNQRHLLSKAIGENRKGTNRQWGWVDTEWKSHSLWNGVWPAQNPKKHFVPVLALLTPLCFVNLQSFWLTEKRNALGKDDPLMKKQMKRKESKMKLRLKQKTNKVKGQPNNASSNSTVSHSKFIALQSDIEQRKNRQCFEWT